MPIQAIFPNGAPAPGGAYSPVVRAGQFLFLSGQAAIDPATGKVVGTTVAEQVEQTMRNIQLLLEGVDASLAQVVKTTAYLSSIDDWAEFNHAYGAFFDGPPPARTAIGAGLKDLLVEIDVIAYIG